MGNSMNSCHWDKIESFRSIGEFKRFIEWIDAQEKDGNAEKIQVKKPYAGSILFDERWIKCKTCGTIWRIVAPDPPFEGVFEPVAS